MPHGPTLVPWLPSQGSLGKQECDKAERILITGPIMIHFLEMVHGLPKKWDFVSQRETIAFGKSSIA